MAKANKQADETQPVPSSPPASAEDAARVDPTPPAPHPPTTDPVPDPAPGTDKDGKKAAAPPDDKAAAAHPAAPACDRCGRALEVYAGDNPHKVGTGFCRPCGKRQAVGG